MAKKNTTQAMASETTKRGTDRVTHKWTPEQLTFLADRPDTKREDLGAEFRKAFPDFKGSTTAIVGKRYTLLHKGSTAHPEIGRRSLEARAQRLRDELAEVEAQLAGMNDTAPSVDDLIGKTMTELRQLAKERGVKASGSKGDIAERIVNAA